MVDHNIQKCPVTYKLYFNLINKPIQLIEIESGDQLLMANEDENEDSETDEDDDTESDEDTSGEDEEVGKEKKSKDEKSLKRKTGEKF